MSSSKRKSHNAMPYAVLGICIAVVTSPSLAVEPGNLFVTETPTAQASPRDPKVTQVRAVDQSECQDAVKLYLDLSATHNAPQRAAEALIETIYRHETMQRLVAIAAAAGCSMRPFIDEEVRRNKRR